MNLHITEMWFCTMYVGFGELMWEILHVSQDFWIKQKPLIILDKFVIAKLNHAYDNNSRMFVLLDLTHSNCSHQTSFLLQFLTFYVLAKAIFTRTGACVLILEPIYKSDWRIAASVLIAGRATERQVSQQRNTHRYVCPDRCVIQNTGRFSVCYTRVDLSVDRIYAMGLPVWVER